MLRGEISRLLSHELKDPRLAGFISLTHVDTAIDLSHAKVFVSVMGSSEDKRNTLKALGAASGFIRHQLMRVLAMRNVPTLSFALDETMAQAAEILETIHEIVTPSEVDEREA
mgnify:CR=1 FL=1